jgi:hypothetical protein
MKANYGYLYHFGKASVFSKPWFYIPMQVSFMLELVMMTGVNYV